MHGHVDNLARAGRGRDLLPLHDLQHRRESAATTTIIARSLRIIRRSSPRTCPHVRRTSTSSTIMLALDHRKALPKQAVPAFCSSTSRDITAREVSPACDAAYMRASDDSTCDVRSEGRARCIELRATRTAAALSCWPAVRITSIPEINHGIDKLICELRRGRRDGGCRLRQHDRSSRRDVLNQWTYHARLYAAAKYVATQRDNAESRPARLLRLRRGRHHHRRGARDSAKTAAKIYTQIKIDEITNLGAVTHPSPQRCSPPSTGSGRKLAKTEGRLDGNAQQSRCIYTAKCEKRAIRSSCRTCCPIHLDSSDRQMLRLNGYNVELLTNERPERSWTEGLQIRAQRHLLPRAAGHRPVDGRDCTPANTTSTRSRSSSPRPAAAAVPPTTSHLLRKALEKDGLRAMMPVIFAQHVAVWRATSGFKLTLPHGRARSSRALV